MLGLTYDYSCFPPAVGPQQQPGDRRRVRRPREPSRLAGADGPGGHGGGGARGRGRRRVLCLALDHGPHRGRERQTQRPAAGVANRPGGEWSRRGRDVRRRPCWRPGRYLADAVPGHAVRQGNPARRGVAAGRRDPDRAALRPGRPAGHTDSGGGDPWRRRDRLDAAGRDPARGHRGQNQGGSGRRLGPARGRPRPGGRRGAADGLRLGLLGADLARAAGLRRSPGRGGAGAAALGPEVLARPGGRTSRSGACHRKGRDRRPPARLGAADTGADPAACRQRARRRPARPGAGAGVAGVALPGSRAGTRAGSPPGSRRRLRTWRTRWGTPSTS